VNCTPGFVWPDIPATPSPDCATSRSTGNDADPSRRAAPDRRDHVRRPAGARLEVLRVACSKCSRSTVPVADGAGVTLA
jgi:hypothetical protein